METRSTMSLQSRKEAAEKMVATKAMNKAAREAAEHMQKGFQMGKAMCTDRDRDKVWNYLDKKHALTQTLWSLMSEGLLEKLLGVDEAIAQVEEEAAAPPPKERKKFRDGSRKFHQCPKAVALEVLTEINGRYAAAYQKEAFDPLSVLMHGLHVCPDTDLPLKQDKTFVYVDNFTKWAVWRHEQVGSRLGGDKIITSGSYWTIDADAKTFTAHIGGQSRTYPMKFDIVPEETKLQHGDHIMKAKVVCEAEGVDQTLVSLAVSRSNSQVTGAEFKKHFVGHELPKLSPELVAKIIGESEDGESPDLRPDDSVSQIGQRAQTVVFAAGTNVGKKRKEEARELEQELKRRGGSSGTVKAALPKGAPKKKQRRGK